ncbi:L-rhamnose-binding lectin SML-like isoform 3-T3 [Polymixia lowei]
MLHIRFSTTLLLAAVCCIFTSAEDGVILVEKALYGRTNRETCSEGRPPGQVANTTCSQEGTLGVLANRCNGKKVCEVNRNDFHASDPCHGTFKYLDTTYTCLPAIHLVECENSVAHLYCDYGQVISIHGADYGRRDQTTCSYKRPASQIANVYCSNPTAKVSESCTGKDSCTINVSNSVFGDPCFGTYKYLELAYTCECKYLKDLQYLGCFILLNLT